MTDAVTVLVGDNRETQRALAAGSAHMAACSPPYFGLRSYLPAGHPDKAREIGTQPTVEAFVAALVDVFRETRRVLRDDAVLFVNLGDSYSTGAGKVGKRPGGGPQGDRFVEAGPSTPANRLPSCGAPAGNLLLVPARFALAMQADGWVLRQEIVWSKPAPMPESVTSRCTRAHEVVFMFAKRASGYFYDADAVREPMVKGADGSRFDVGKTGANGMGRVSELPREDNPAGRNKRSVWTVASAPSKLRHFAMWPPALVEPMVLAGTSARGCCPVCGAQWRRVTERTAMVVREGPGRRGLRAAAGDASGARTACTGTMISPPSSTTTGWSTSCACPAHDPVPCTVLDPFGGAGTTAGVATYHGRAAVLCELSAAYAEHVPARVAEVHAKLARDAAKAGRARPVTLPAAPPANDTRGQLSLFGVRP